MIAVRTKTTVPVFSPSSVQILPQSVASTKQIPVARTLEYIGNVSNTTNEKVFGEIKKLLAHNANESIYLTVSSTGGPTGPAMCFYEMIQKILRANLVTIGVGDVDSSGVIVFLSGSQRFISPYTTILLHMAGRRFDPAIRYTADDLEAMAHEDHLKDMQYATIVANASHALSVDNVLALMKKSTVLTSQDLVNLGLAHELLS